MEVQSLILVVDDQARGRLALGSLLEPEGYRVIFAGGGQEPFEQLRLHTPDLILLDVMMPEIDGFEVCRRIRADAALALIPVIMVTALNDQESIVQGLEAGADDFVSKPFNRVELRARVRTVTRLNRFRVVLEEQRRAASERARLLWALERSSDGYLLLDAEDRPQHGNAQAWRYLGLAAPPERGLDEPLLTVARRSYRLEPEEAWASWPGPTSATRYLVRPEGANSLWLQVALLDLPDGGPGSRMVHLRDVSDQISARRDIWSFHSFVSHKLRTPMTSLMVGMGLLHRQAEALPPDLAMLADTAYSGAKRLKGVVDDIFRYLEAPAGEPDTQGLALADVAALAAQVAADLQIAAARVEVEPGLGPQRVALSAHTLGLLLTELLENARKFHPRNAPAVVVALRRRGADVSICVSDDALTLSATQLRRIWEPYQQIDSEFTGQVPGVGLGLATVAQICWAAGGTCRIANRPDGPGLTAELVLPIAADGTESGRGTR